MQYWMVAKSNVREHDMRVSVGFVSTVFLFGLCACSAVSAAPSGQAPVTSSAVPAYVDTLLHQARHEYHSSQVILTTVAAPDKPRASLSTWTFASGHWQRTLGPIGAVVGKNGISLHKREGDMKSPAGIFYIGRSFGSAPRPAGDDMPYTRTTRYDYWVDDATSPDYNRWVTYYRDPDARWKSFERLKIPAYEYAAVIQYNTDPIVKGRGSAIFFHIWPGPDGSTAGCTAVSRQNVLKVLRWMDPAKQPLIIQGTVAQLKTLAQDGARQ